MKRLIAHELGACNADNVDVVSHATHTHEHAARLNHIDDYYWRQTVHENQRHAYTRENILLAHDYQEDGRPVADCWDAIY